MSSRWKKLSEQMHDQQFKSKPASLKIIDTSPRNSNFKEQQNDIRGGLFKKNIKVSLQNQLDRKNLVRTLRIPPLKRTYLQIEMIAQILKQTEFYKVYLKYFQRDPLILKSIGRRLKYAHFRPLESPLKVFQQSQYIFIVIQEFFYQVIDLKSSSSFDEQKNGLEQIEGETEFQIAVAEQSDNDSTPQPQKSSFYSPQSSSTPQNFSHQIKGVHMSSEQVTFRNQQLEEFYDKKEIQTIIPECYFVKKIGIGEFFGDVPIRHMTYSPCNFISNRHVQTAVIDLDLYLQIFGRNHEIMDTIDILKESSLMKQLKPTLIELLIGLSQTEEYFKGSYILSRRIPNDRIFFIIEGEVEIGQVQQNQVISNFICHSPRGEINKINQIFNSKLNSPRAIIQTNQVNNSLIEQSETLFDSNSQLFNDEFKGFHFKGKGRQAHNSDQEQFDFQSQEQQIKEEKQLRQKHKLGLEGGSKQLGVDEILNVAAIIGQGEFFGEVDDFNTNFYLDVIVYSQTCKVLSLPFKTFLEIAEIYGFDKNQIFNTKKKWRFNRTNLIHEVNQRVSNINQNPSDTIPLNKDDQSEPLYNIQSPKSVVTDRAPTEQVGSNDNIVELVDKKNNLELQFNQLKKNQTKPHYLAMRKPNVFESLSFRNRKSMFMNQSSKIIKTQISSFNASSTNYMNTNASQSFLNNTNISKKHYQLSTHRSGGSSQIFDNQQKELQMVPIIEDDEKLKKKYTKVLRMIENKKHKNDPQFPICQTLTFPEDIVKNGDEKLKNLAIYKKLNLDNFCQNTEQEQIVKEFLQDIQETINKEDERKKKIYREKICLKTIMKTEIYGQINHLQAQLNQQWREKLEKQRIEFENKQENLHIRGEFLSYNFKN